MHTVRQGFLPVAAQKKETQKNILQLHRHDARRNFSRRKHLLHPNVAVVSQRKHQDGVKSIASCRDDVSYAKDPETFHGERRRSDGRLHVARENTSDE